MEAEKLEYHVVEIVSAASSRVPAAVIERVAIMCVHRATNSSGLLAACTPSVNHCQKKYSTQWWAGVPRSRIGRQRESGASVTVMCGIARATSPKTQLSNWLGS